jgi:hypothetical protein
MRSNKRLERGRKQRGVVEEALRDVVVGTGRPSMDRGAELAKSVDGRPSPTMTAWRDGASTAALVQ